MGPDAFSSSYHLLSPQTFLLFPSGHFERTLGIPSLHTLAHARSTHSFSAPLLPHPYPLAPSSLRLQTLQRPKALLILGHTLLPGPGLHTQQTSGTCWWAAWVFWAEIPKASEPMATLCHTTHCSGHGCSRFGLIPLSPLHTEHLPLTAHRPPAPGSAAS